MTSYLYIIPDVTRISYANFPWWADNYNIENAQPQSVCYRFIAEPNMFYTVPISLSEEIFSIDTALVNDPDFVTVSIYDILGREVKTLINKTLDAGFYTAQWDGTSDRGVAAPSGIYFSILKTKQNISKKKMILIR